MSINLTSIIRDSGNMVWSSQITLRFRLVSHLWFCLCRVSHTVLHIQHREAIFEADVGEISQNSSKVSTDPGLEEALLMMCENGY